MASIKQLPISPQTAVFRVTDNFLRNDPVLRSVVRPDNFR